MKTDLFTHVTKDVENYESRLEQPTVKFSKSEEKDSKPLSKLLYRLTYFVGWNYVKQYVPASLLPHLLLNFIAFFGFLAGNCFGQVLCVIYYASDLFIRRLLPLFYSNNINEEQKLNNSEFVTNLYLRIFTSIEFAYVQRNLSSSKWMLDKSRWFEAEYAIRFDLMVFCVFSNQMSTDEMQNGNHSLLD